ncbi:MAG: hypothetical protein ACRDSN_08585 [Pseudonocardiaceae bacterium]
MWLLIISVSVVLLLGVVVVALCRRGGLKTWHAVVCALFGFYLATSAVAPTVRQVVGELARLIGGH